MAHLPDDFIFSQSSLQDYVDCPRRFELRYMLRQRWPGPEVDDMLDFEERMRRGDRFHQLVHQHLIGIPVDRLKRRINDDVIETWFEAYLHNGLADVPAQRTPERTLTAPLGDYALLARYDLIAIGDGRALIVDWKTSQHMPRAARVRQRMQTRVYRYLLATSGATLNGGQPIPPEQVTMVYWYAAHGGQRQVLAYDQAQYEADAAYLRELVAEIVARDDFPLTDDAQRCRYCVYRSLCNRGVVAGPLDAYESAGDAGDADDALADFTLDLDQIGEIAF